MSSPRSACALDCWRPEIPERATLGFRTSGPLIDRLIHREVERHGTTYVSLIDLLCKEDGCLVQTDGELTTWDTGHFTLRRPGWSLSHCVREDCCPRREGRAIPLPVPSARRV